MWWFFAYALHLWRADLMLYVTLGCAFPLVTYGCGWDAGLIDHGRVYEWLGNR